MFSLYGLILTFSCFLAFLWARSRSQQYGIGVWHIDNVVIISVPFILIGARIYHLLTDWELYADGSLVYWQFWQGGLGFWGAFLSGLCIFALYSKINKISFISLCTIFSLPLLLSISLGRLGNIANQELVPFAYYESFVTFCLLVILYVWEKSSKNKKDLNILFPTLFFYGLNRFFLEFIRTEKKIVGVLNTNQVVSLLVIITTLLLWISVFRKKNIKET